MVKRYLYATVQGVLAVREGEVNAVWGIGYLYLSRFWGFDNSAPYVFIVTLREKAHLFGKKVAELPKDKPLVTRLFCFHGCQERRIV